ncbi:MAG TPA: hypothetical protein VFZ41_06130, partial [Solirubrobacterales bacterium]
MLLGALAAAAPAGAETRTVEFRGEAARVPASWPIYRLAKHPRMCVRLDRRAVYLGTPSRSQRCPARGAGRRVAIVIDGRDAAVSALAPVAGPAVFTGLGFDACTAPSPRAMRTWRASSPYQAVGVYIGGINRACSQPNLTSRWVAEQVA